jgi:hypothetical protein
MPSLDEIHESIEARLGQLRAEISSLQAARAALHGSNAQTTSTTRASARSATSRPKRTTTTSSAPKGGTGGQAATETAVAGSASGAAEVTPTRTAAATRPARRTRRSTSKRVEVLLADKLEALLAESDGGLSVAAIVARSRARDGQVRALLRELDGTGRVRRTGAGRGTRWRVVTDEERIAERAAELAARSSSRAKPRRRGPAAPAADR